MLSQRIQRQIERLLDEADEAAARRDWATVRERAEHVLTFDPENGDAGAFLAAAERGLANMPPAAEPSDAEAQRAVRSAAGPLSPGGREPVLSGAEGLERGGSATPQETPTAFANGRYTVRRFLGEGGKKRVYLAHDTLLDRDVAFALIKTEGLDEQARARITREAQAMGRLGDHPHIVTVYDIGVERFPLPLGEGEGEGGQPYLVLPLMPGGDVEGLIEQAENHQLPPRARHPHHRPALPGTRARPRQGHHPPGCEAGERVARLSLTPTLSQGEREPEHGDGA